MDLKWTKRFYLTGGAIRIGRAISKELSKHGVNVAINYNNSGDQAEQLKRNHPKQRKRLNYLRPTSATFMVPELFAKVKQSFWTMIF